MRKGLKEEILNRCKINELNIDNDKAYIVKIEVGDIPKEEIMNILKQVAEVFKQQLKIDRCVFAPMSDGKELFSIRDLTDNEAEHITKLYDLTKQRETPKGSE